MACAPNSHLRVQVTPGQRGRHTGEDVDRTAAAGQAGMTWAQRLKRVFKIAIETCRHCGGSVKVIACIEDPVVIKQIVAHLERHAQQPPPRYRRRGRLPPFQF